LLAAGAARISSSVVVWLVAGPGLVEAELELGGEVVMTAGLPDPLPEALEALRPAPGGAPIPIVVDVSGVVIYFSAAQLLPRGDLL